MTAPILIQRDATQYVAVVGGGGSPWPGNRGKSPAGGRPGECPGAEAPQAEAPKLLQRGWPGNSLSTCEEKRKRPLPGAITRVSEAEGPRKGPERQEGTQVDEQWPGDTQTPAAESPVACFPLEASGDHPNLTQTLRNKGHRLEHQNQGPEPPGQADVGLGSGSAASCVTLVQGLNFSELPPL